MTIDYPTFLVVECGFSCRRVPFIRFLSLKLMSSEGEDEEVSAPFAKSGCVRSTQQSQSRQFKDIATLKRSLGRECRKRRGALMQDLVHAEAREEKEEEVKLMTC